MEQGFSWPNNNREISREVGEPAGYMFLTPINQRSLW